MSSRRWLVAALACGAASSVLLAASPAAAQDGVSIATVVVPKDSPSSQQAVVIGQIARQGFARSPRYAVLNLERMLDGGADRGQAELVKKAEEALDRGQAAYDAFELDPALEGLAEAVVAYEQALGALADITPLVDAYRFQGAAYALKGDVDASSDAFVKALILDEGADLSGGQFPDTVQAIFEQARGKVAELGSGSVTVYAAPAAAEVWVDGGFRGSAPITVTDLPVGRHYVRVVRDGYLAFGEAVDVAAKSESTVQATLRPTTGLSAFDQTRLKLANADERAAADLAAQLKVEQLFWATVEVTGDTVKVSGFLTDGVGGGTLATADKAFPASSPRFRSDVESWLAENFRKEGSASASTSTTTGNGESFMPDAPVDPPTPGLVIAGWIVTPLAILPFLVGAVSGLAALYFFDLYFLEGSVFSQPVLDQTGVLNHQQANSDQGRVLFALLAVTAIIGDVLMLLVTPAVAAAGITMLTIGLNEKAEIEDVLAGAPFAGDDRLAME